MREFNYYRTNKYEYHDPYTIKRRLKKELDEKPLTVEDRKKQESELQSIATAESRKLNQPYYAEQRRLDDEFWADAREEIGYCGYLDEKGVQILEHRAYEDGHSYGYPEIYSKLVDLEQFIDEIRQHIRQG